MNEVRALLVDDSADDAELNALALRRSGLKIVSQRVETRDAASAALREGRWDIVLCDYEMPNFSAPALLALLLDMHLDLPCIIVSGAIGEEAAADVMRLGAIDYVFKNNLARLRASVDRALREALVQRDHRLTQARLLESEARLKLMVEQLPAMVWTTDSEMNITSAKGTEVASFGVELDAMIGQPFPAALFSTEEDRAVATHAHRQALRGDSFRFEVKWAGRRRQAHIEPLRDREDAIIGTIGIALDVTEQREAQERLSHVVNHDALTDLPNRVLLNDRLTQALGFAQRRNRHVAVLYLDIDGFKYVNETLGYPVGDELLKTVAGRLLLVVNEADTVARSGGDDFVIVLADIDGVEVARTLEQRVLDVFEKPFTIHEHEIFLTASVGVTHFPEDGGEGPGLMKGAEAAMYEAKRMGRNCIQEYRPSMLAAPAERLTLQRDIHHALLNQEFVLHYQPMLDVETERVVGVEALLRWRHPTLGLLMPDGFIPVAEESGLIEPIGEWVFEQACMQLARWREEGHADLRVSVNVSARQFESRGLRKMIMRVLAAHRVAAEQMELEVTESSIMRDVGSTIRILADLKDLGLRLSIDDFGTGYTSLSYLKRFPIDVLKIDRYFVRDIMTNVYDEAIVKAVTTLSRRLGLTTIAEGVETRAQFERIRDLECDEVQGYLFSPALPADECAALFKERLSSRISV